jgi:8-oxo-dGTP diphosphatase
MVDLAACARWATTVARPSEIGSGMVEDEAGSLDFLQSLPTKRMGAGLLLRDDRGWPLLVEPAYKADWEIPGGVVELDESPRECVVREVREELGIAVVPGRLLVVDYQHAREHRTESLMFVFDGGVLDERSLAAVTLPADELASHAFVEPSRLGALTSERLARRLLRALEATADAACYLENGADPSGR